VVIVSERLRSSSTLAAAGRNMPYTRPPKIQKEPESGSPTTLEGPIIPWDSLETIGHQRTRGKLTLDFFCCLQSMEDGSCCRLEQVVVQHPPSKTSQRLEQARLVYLSEKTVRVAGKISRAFRRRFLVDRCARFRVSMSMRNSFFSGDRKTADPAVLV
jgi:hypothetical protein